MKETFWISTQLSSTKLTQNGTQLICSRRLSRSWIMCLNMHDYTWKFQTVFNSTVTKCLHIRARMIVGVSFWYCSRNLTKQLEVTALKWGKTVTIYYGSGIQTPAFSLCAALTVASSFMTVFTPLYILNGCFAAHRLKSEYEPFSIFPGVWHSCCLPVDLLALLKWKAHPDRVMDILGRLRHVSGEEIVKVRFEVEQVGRLFCLICVNTCIVDHHNIL